MASILVTVQLLVFGFQGPCYHDHSCNPKAFDLPACVHTPYQCHPDEMCVFSVSGHDTKAECQDKAKMPACQADQMVNDPACDPHHPPPGHHACTYCCLDDQCMKSLASPQSAVTGPTAQPQTTPVPQTAPKGSCYTSPCHHGNDFATCSSGQWGCGSDQYCNLHFGANGDVHMDCHPLTELQHCQGETSHNHGQCEPYVAGQGDCRYCCADEDCMNLKVLGIQPTSTTLAPATTSHPCVDEYTGDCSVDFAGQCSDPIVMKVCELTCGICNCTDNYHGDCAADFAGQCDSPVVQKICPRTCGHCQTALAATTTIPTTTAATTTIIGITTMDTTTIDTTTAANNQPAMASSTGEPCKDKYLGNCLSEFPDQCSDAIVRDVCKQSCGYCHGTTIPDPMMG